MKPHHTRPMARMPNGRKPNLAVLSPTSSLRFFRDLRNSAGINPATMRSTTMPRMQSTRSPSHCQCASRKPVFRSASGICDSSQREAESRKVIPRLPATREDLRASSRSSGMAATVSFENRHSPSLLRTTSTEPTV